MPRRRPASALAVAPLPTRSGRSTEEEGVYVKSAEHQTPQISRKKSSRLVAIDKETLDQMKALVASAAK